MSEPVPLPSQLSTNWPGPSSGARERGRAATASRLAAGLHAGGGPEPPSTCATHCCSTRRECSGSPYPSAAGGPRCRRAHRRSGLWQPREGGAGAVIPRVPHATSQLPRCADLGATPPSPLVPITVATCTPSMNTRHPSSVLVSENTTMSGVSTHRPPVISIVNCKREGM